MRHLEGEVSDSFEANDCISVMRRFLKEWLVEWFEGYLFMVESGS